MFAREKYGPDGVWQQLKTRLVAGGHRQNRAAYTVEETSSPTVALTSAYITAAIAAKEGRKVMTADVAGAYLNSKTEKPVFMRLSKHLAKILVDIDASAYAPFVARDGSLLVELEKALYGLIEAGLLWHKNVCEFMTSLGFVQNGKDACVFNKLTSAGVQLTVIVYVDDFFSTCVDQSSLDWFAAELTAKYGKVKTQSGEVVSWVGQTFDFRDRGKCKVSMAGFIDELLRFTRTTGFAATPATEDLFDIDQSAAPLAREEAEYLHTVVMKLLYAAKRVRPDLLVTTSFLSKRVTKSTVQDMGKLDRACRYLNSTRDLGIVLEPSRSLHVLAYADAAYGVHEDYKSHSGAMITFGRGPIFAKSSTQKLNTKSSTEAELVALADVLSEVLWVREFLQEQGYDVPPAVIMQDNTSTIALAKKGRGTSDRTRHIGIRYFFVKDRIASNEVKVEYLKSADMLADALTKPCKVISSAVCVARS
jgi:hypothetical protein